jgi:2,3-bisphosphoglycerate-independent phosphoglycerate mutase
MGNSEVGHMNIGAGRIVFQELAKINNDINSGVFRKNERLNKSIDHAVTKNKNIHLLGLVSEGGVHSHVSHLYELVDLIESKNNANTFIHAFTDGRDVDPKSGLETIKQLLNYLDGKETKLASICGRYFAMDRDKRWERIKKAYDLLLNNTGLFSNNPVDALKKSYENGVTDEFLEPIVITDDKNTPITKIEEGDLVVFFNFRTDRGRQLTEVLTQFDLDEFKMKKLDLDFITMTSYNDDYKNISTIYKNQNLRDTLGEVLEKNKKHQIRIAETEKYPHVTFFFNGGAEKEFKNEKRILCQSPKVATYDLKPEMSAYKITDSILTEIKGKTTDFICLNFANPDMVGHTGNFNAAIKACEVVDECSKKIIKESLKNNYSIMVIADHGNSDVMKNNDGSPNTAHTTNPVPIIIIDDDVHKINDGILADIAPTILNIMGIEQPKLMTGNILI